MFSPSSSLVAPPVYDPSQARAKSARSCNSPYTPLPTEGDTQVIAKGPRRLASLSLALLLLALPAPARGEARVYHVQHRTAEELLPLAQTALAGQGSAVMDSRTNSIVLIGEPQVLTEALQLLTQQDRRPRTIVVTYTSLSREALDALHLEIDWSVSAGSLRMGNVRGQRGKAHVAIAPQAKLSERTSEGKGALRILEGESGRLSTGVSIPVTTVGRHDVSTRFVPVDSGFEARPRILGDGRVQLDLSPFEAEPLAGGAVAFREAATRVTLRPGERIALGQITGSGTQRLHEVPSNVHQEHVHDERILLLEVSIE